MITINKICDVPIMNSVKRMIDDVNTHHPSHITIVSDGIKFEFVDVDIKCDNGFMVITDGDSISHIKYQYLSSYHISHMMADDIESPSIKIDDDDAFMIWDELYREPSTISPSILNQKISTPVKRESVINFIEEMEGVTKEDIFDGDRLEDLFNSFMGCDTIDKLNDEFKDYYLSFFLTSDMIKEDINDGTYDSKDDLKWIKNIVEGYIDLEGVINDEYYERD